jgi:hypothetical protein
MFFFTAQPFDPADSPRELHHTQSLEQQISDYRHFIICAFQVIIIDFHILGLKKTKWDVKGQDEFCVNALGHIAFIDRSLHG